MTGRTHDLAGFTALSIIASSGDIPKMTLATALFGLSACFIGALAPDIDQPTADLWGRIPAGSVIGRIFSPFLGGHRFISHSIIGIILFGVLLKMLLAMASTIILVDMNIVWWCFMIGFISHLLIDMLTKEGVPWLFPIPFVFCFPPLQFLRIKTTGLVEKSVIFPGLLFLNVYVYVTHYHVFLSFLKNLF